MQSNLAETVDYDVEDAPLDTLDARPELSFTEEAHDEIMRRVGGSWIMAAIMEGLFTMVFTAQAIVHPLLPKSWRSSPVELTAEKLAVIDEIKEERTIERSEVVVSTASNIRFIARQLASGGADFELMQRLAKKDQEWLLALSTAEQDRIGDATLKQVALHQQDVPSIAGVRTPRQVEQGIAAVVNFGVHTAQPPLVTKEQILEARRRGVAGKGLKAV